MVYYNLGLFSNFGSIDYHNIVLTKVIDKIWQCSNTAKN